MTKDNRQHAFESVRGTPEDEQHSLQFAVRLNNLAVLHQTELEFTEGDVRYKESLAILERLLGADHPQVAMSLSNRASLYRLMQEYHEAERIYQIALEIWRRRGWPTQAEMSQGYLSDDTPLWAERIDEDGMPVSFRSEIQSLRRQVENGNPDARVKLERVLNKHGRWFHGLNFGGVESNPGDPNYPTRRWEVLNPHVPQDLTGKTVLDIGCNGGYFSLELKRRNAKRVVAIDFMAHWVSQVRFASCWFDLPIEPRLLDVYDVESLGAEFDIVVFVGVLYHLRHPLYALDKVSNVCKGMLLFQSLSRGPVGDFTPADNYNYEDETFLDDPRFPRMYFIEKSFNNDESNWWIATQSCLKAMLRSSGFKRITETSLPDHFICYKS